MGKKKGIAKANKDSASGDEKFKAEEKKLADAITTNIKGIEILRLCHDKAWALTLLATVFPFFAVCSENANCRAPRKDKTPNFSVNSKVKSANNAGPINRANIILNNKFAAFAIFAETNKIVAGPIMELLRNNSREVFAVRDI